MGMGEAFVAMADDVSAAHYNPAGLAFRPAGAVPPVELMVSHSMHIQDIQMTQFGVAKRPWGMSLTHLRMGGIERRTSETRQPDGTFGASDMALGLSYGRKLGSVGVGGSFKYIRQTIAEYSASAYAVDVGALRRMERLPVTFGAGLANLGTQVRFVENGYPLPTVFRVGAAAGMTKKFPHAVSVQLDFPRDGGPAFRIGMEYLGFGPFALRAGYRTYSAAQRSAALGKALGSDGPGLSEFYGMFMGVGFRTKLGSMDYTLLPYGELGNAHRFSLSFKFGRSRTAFGSGASSGYASVGGKGVAK